GCRLAIWRAEKREARVWGVAAQRVDRTIAFKSPLVGQALSPDGEMLAGFRGPNAVVLTPARSAGESECLCDAVGGVAGRFSPDGEVLAVSAPTRARGLFDVETRRAMAASPCHPQPPPPPPLPP